MADPVVLLSTGDVVGPNSSTDGTMVLFDGTSGKKVKGNNAVVTPQGLALLDDLTPADNRNTIGLGQVNNTSDINKPISNAQQTAIDLKLDKTGGPINGSITVRDTVSASSMEVRSNGGTAFIDLSNDLVTDYDVRIVLIDDDTVNFSGAATDGLLVNGFKVWSAGNFNPSTKANTATTIDGYGITDAYTKTQSDAITDTKVVRDSITNAGFAGNDVSLPYMRRLSDGLVYYLQRRLGFTPVQQGTGAGQGNSNVQIGWNNTTGKLYLAVDATNFAGTWPIDISGNATTANSAATANTANTATTANSATTATRLVTARRFTIGGKALMFDGQSDMSWTAAEIVDLSPYALKDSISIVGFASNDPTMPYMRRTSDGGVYYLQPRLGFNPVQQGTGVGQAGNLIKIGWSGSAVKITVDNSDAGNIVMEPNFGATNAKLVLSSIGTYAFARPLQNSNINQGESMSGSSLLYSSTIEADGTTSNSGIIGVGTWRCQGAMSGVARTLWLRVN